MYRLAGPSKRRYCSNCCPSAGKKFRQSREPIARILFTFHLAHPSYAGTATRPIGESPEGKAGVSPILFFLDFFGAWTPRHGTGPIGPGRLQWIDSSPGLQVFSLQIFSNFFLALHWMDLPPPLAGKHALGAVLAGRPACRWDGSAQPP